MRITVACVGTKKEELTLEVAQAAREADRVILHTERCGFAEWLKENGVSYEALDALYETAEDFDEHAQLAAEAVLNASPGHVLYAVLDEADQSVKALFRAGARVRVLGAGAFGELLARAEGPVTLISASQIEGAALTAENDCVVKELDSRMQASEVKLRLMEVYPEDAPVSVTMPGGGVAEITLTELDRLSAYDHRSGCLVRGEKDFMRHERNSFRDLMALTARLRSPMGGCPWDRKQTHESLKRACVEEAYELMDAIEQGDEIGMIEELGDVLFVAAMQIQIGIDHGEFDAADVLTGAVRKMIARHAHVFGGETAADADEVLKIWDQKKNTEKGFHSAEDRMRAVAKALPALLKAQKLWKKAGEDDPSRAEAALAGVTGEGGELLRLAVRLKQSGIDAEEALSKACEAFIENYSRQECKIVP